MRGRGAFAEELARLADEVADPRLTAVAAALSAPLRVAVAGRAGVGCRTVAEALRRTGVTITTQPDPDAVVYVLAEVVKPEDVTALAGLTGPVLVVLNKTDVTGGVSAAQVAARLGRPVQPVSALAAPAGGIGELAARLAGPAAVAHHRRWTAAVTCLEALAVEEPRIWELLLGEETVAARLAAAEAAAAAFGCAGPAGGPDADLRRARRWQRYRTAPVSAPVRACATDITRGALRRWLRAQEPA